MASEKRELCFLYISVWYVRIWAKPCFALSALLHSGPPRGEACYARGRHRAVQRLVRAPDGPQSTLGNLFLCNRRRVGNEMWKHQTQKGSQVCVKIIQGRKIALRVLSCGQPAWHVRSVFQLRLTQQKKKKKSPLMSSLRNARRYCLFYRLNHQKLQRVVHTFIMKASAVSVVGCYGAHTV